MESGIISNSDENPEDTTGETLQGFGHRRIAPGAAIYTDRASAMLVNLKVQPWRDAAK